MGRLAQVVYSDYFHLGVGEGLAEKATPNPTKTVDADPYRQSMILL